MTFRTVTTALCKWERELKSGKFGGGSPPCAMGGACRGPRGALRGGAVVREQKLQPSGNPVVPWRA